MTGKIQFKAIDGQLSVDKAEGIVECFVAAIGNKDSVNDIIVPGAFTASLQRRNPRVVWGHDWNQPIGKVLQIEEVSPGDSRLPAKMKAEGVGGLWARVQFNLNSERGREAFASVLFFGEDQEWSIGYKTLDAVFDRSRQANILRLLELYEVSPVLHGANAMTATMSIKADAAGLPIDAPGNPAVGEAGLVAKSLGEHIGSPVHVVAITGTDVVYSVFDGDVPNTFSASYKLDGDTIAFGEAKAVQWIPGPIAEPGALDNVDLSPLQDLIDGLQTGSALPDDATLSALTNLLNSLRGSEPNPNVDSADEGDDDTTDAGDTGNDSSAPDFGSLAMLMSIVHGGSMAQTGAETGFGPDDVERVTTDDGGADVANEPEGIPGYGPSPCSCLKGDSASGTCSCGGSCSGDCACGSGKSAELGVEVKAGRVLSTLNVAKLQQAADIITGVLRSAGYEPMMQKSDEEDATPDTVQFSNVADAAALGQHLADLTEGTDTKVDWGQNVVRVKVAELDDDVIAGLAQVAEDWVLSQAE